MLTPINKSSLKASLNIILLYGYKPKGEPKTNDILY